MYSPSMPRSMSKQRETPSPDNNTKKLYVTQHIVTPSSPSHKKQSSYFTTTTPTSKRYGKKQATPSPLFKKKRTSVYPKSRGSPSSTTTSFAGSRRNRRDVTNVEDYVSLLNVSKANPYARRNSPVRLVEQKSSGGYKGGDPYAHNHSEFVAGAKAKLAELFRKYRKQALKKKYFLELTKGVQEAVLWDWFNNYFLNWYVSLFGSNKKMMAPVAELIDNQKSPKKLDFIANLIGKAAAFYKANNLFGYNPYAKSQATQYIDKLIKKPAGTSDFEYGAVVVASIADSKHVRSSLATSLRASYDLLVQNERAQRNARKVMSTKRSDLQSGSMSGSGSYHSIEF